MCSPCGLALASYRANGRRALPGCRLHSARQQASSLLEVANAVQGHWQLGAAHAWPATAGFLSIMAPSHAVSEQAHCHATLPCSGSTATLQTARPSASTWRQMRKPSGSMPPLAGVCHCLFGRKVCLTATELAAQTCPGDMQMRVVAVSPAAGSLAEGKERPGKACMPRLSPLDSVILWQLLSVAARPAVPLQLSHLVHPRSQDYH